MAETTKTSAKRGRPSTKTKTTEVKKEETKVNENNAQDELIKKLMAQIEEQNKKMAEMQEQIQNSKQPVIVQSVSSNSFSGKKVKVINLMHNPLNISTEPDGMGRSYSFREYGESRLIKYDDLADIVSSYPHTMESGCAYICDKEVVESLGLADEYEKLFDKETMDRIVWLRTESDLELFLGMAESLQKSLAKRIAELINANERIDYNYIKVIKDKTGIDIEEIAKDLSDFNKKPEEE